LLDIVNHVIFPSHQPPPSSAIEIEAMNRHATANTTRCLIGTWARARAGNSMLGGLSQLVQFGGAEPGPGEGEVSS
jgi:hypothetical protein